MQAGFSFIDWFIFIAYLIILLFLASYLSNKNINSSREFFTAKNSFAALPVALSLLATAQSAATFLGAPEFSYRYDLTLLGYSITSLLAIYIVVKVLIPKLYEMKAISVYELLQERFGGNSRRDVGIMFLVGRLFASGARLYMAALALSMILFYDISLVHVSFSVILLTLGALIFTYFGGIKSIIISDILQIIVYLGAGIAVVIYLYLSLAMDFNQIFQTLSEAQKLKYIDFELGFTNEGKFNIFSLLTGYILLNIAAFGLDQDLAQRVLSCKDKKQAGFSLYGATLLSIPVSILFLSIGLLLFLYYQEHTISQKFAGESITIFMYYILNEMPNGLKGFVTIGAIAAALSSTNSVLGAMSSVAIEDIYKPYKIKHKNNIDETHFVKTAKTFVLIFAFLLSLMAILSFIIHSNSSIPLISFALGVMAYAYSGLLGVFASALFTNRGNSKLIPYALFIGFASVFCMQGYTFGLNIGFAWQLVIGTTLSFGVMQLGKK
ncbi:sodium:solute symporter family transporter [Arcobacter arenosus]|uniref:sodium:solute symporter family transporter n=1 Tax=Arcobacter arenosus TaxID=2576037 RepID=UPI003BA8C0C1